VVAEIGHFTRAAAALGYVQSTVTTHIQALEKELEVRLFDRLGKGVRLTEAGNRLLIYAQKILTLTEEMRGAIHSDAAISGTLTISAPETLCIYRLPALLREFRAQYPHAKVIFRPCRVADLRREVNDGVLDAALLLEESIQNSGMVVEPLLLESLVIIASAEHRLRDKAVVCPTDLAESPFS